MDNATNRRLNRVGQSYGNIKEEQDNGPAKVPNAGNRQTRRLPEFESLYKRCEELSDEDVRLGISEHVAENWMKRSDKALEGYWEGKLPVSATATGIARGFL